MSEPAAARISESELRFTWSRSSGPGGQHVNHVETRVTLLFDLDGSPSLSDDEKRAIRARLASRVNQDGVLRVVAQRHRTREANRRAAIERFEELLAQALRPRRPRRATRPTSGARQRRMATKRRRAEVKRGRSRPASDE